MNEPGVITADPPQLVNQNGQRIGAKGQRTRQRLIEVTVHLLETHGLRDLTVAEVARVAQTSPATFYVYFDGVPDVVLAALAATSQTTPELLDLLQQDWIGAEGKEKARTFVQLYCAQWESHRTVFRVRNLAAEEGDPRFMEARRGAVRGLLELLARRVAAARSAGRVDPSTNGPAQAAAILILLERLAAVRLLIVPGETDYGLVMHSAADMIAHAMGAG
ncbi:TetR/AcrR family transcriptional regulator [Novosphingobium tardum]|uniref:TetR/AcrR family transcriptional regulator n=1 Tax=Novosphingobium tardum TaxID=1538021 RepID=A0ABV8RRP6_9SPHN